MAKLLFLEIGGYKSTIKERILLNYNVIIIYYRLSSLLIVILRLEFRA